MWTCSASNSITTWPSRSHPRDPRFLIERNLSDLGHLSNRQGAELIQAVLARSRDGSLRHVVLLHLSEQCNQPHLAIQAAGDAIGAAGRLVQVHAARQSPAFPNLWVGPRASRPRAATLAGQSSESRASEK